MRRFRPSITLALLMSACGGGEGSSSVPAPAPQPAPPAVGIGPAACIDGRASGFDCADINLRKNVTLAELGGVSGNDIWGWTDPLSNIEYALVGLDNGVAFVNLDNPDDPLVVGNLPTATVASAWRDIKVAQDHAYVVADGVGNHGMQVFDLTRLRNSIDYQTYAADVIYGDYGSAHNIAINEQSNFAYVVGSNTCAGGLHMIDISTPKNPLFAGCHGADGDTHDAQCVNYAGPDPDHSGKEICFNSNADHVAIVDVSSKSAPVTLMSFTYPDLGYVHQSWLTDDQHFLFVGDELDEQSLGLNTRTLVFDVSDLGAPSFLYSHVAATAATDHNMYAAGNRLYQANYTAGLRILEHAELSADTLSEVAFFDTRPESNAATFEGAWSAYPFFASGTIIVNDIQRGLFILSN